MANRWSKGDLRPIIMIWLYRILFLPALLIVAPFYLRRMLKRGGYRENFSQRFGQTPSLPARRPGVKRVWLQAVSVGEMLAIGPLLEKLAAAGGAEVYLSTTTSTGYKLAKERYLGLTIGIGYFPIDFAPCSILAWRAIAPDLALLMEGERWPEHLAQASRRGVPVLAINARLSDHSFRRMRRARFLVAALFGSPARILACSENDARRFRTLGFAADRILATGNIKLDLTIPLLAAGEKAGLRAELGLPEGLVLLGSSTWPGEEEALLDVLGAARSRGLKVSLLLVPRHAERRGEIEALLGKSGLRYHLRSRGAATSEVDVAVGDTTGELRKLTQLADLVFVGKSLPPHHEGQTPVEAAALGKPLIFASRMTNFREISRALVESGAAQRVSDRNGLISVGSHLLEDQPSRDHMSVAASQWHGSNRGATERTWAEISRFLSEN